MIQFIVVSSFLLQDYISSILLLVFSCWVCPPGVAVSFNNRFLMVILIQLVIHMPVSLSCLTLAAVPRGFPPAVPCGPCVWRDSFYYDRYFYYFGLVGDSPGLWIIIGICYSKRRLRKRFAGRLCLTISNIKRILIS